MTLQKYTYYIKSSFELLISVRPLGRILQVFLRKGAPGEKSISLPRQAVSFKIRGAMDIWSVKETFLDRFYERYGATVGNGWTVVDIGGGIGDFTTFAARAHPSNRVFAFEPTPDSFHLLQENLAHNQVHNAQGFSQAIWSEEGSLWMDTTVGEPGQYISHAESEEPGKTSQQTGVIVPCITLSQAFERLDISQCDLLKMDCEGAEYAILFSTPEETLVKIQRIVMEYHDNVTEYTHADLERYLSEHGFTVQTHQNVVHSYLGYLYAERSQPVYRS